MLVQLQMRAPSAHVVQLLPDEAEQVSTWLTFAINADILQPKERGEKKKEEIFDTV